MLKQITPQHCSYLKRQPFNEKTYGEALAIVEAVKTRGEEAVREYAVKFGDLTRQDQPLLVEPAALEGAYKSLPETEQMLLTHIAGRIKSFAHAQRASLGSASVPCPGGSCFQMVAALESAGCYAPSGRYPLPSSVLMTACTARAAGVKTVIVASPKPSTQTLAAAFAAGADRFFCAGGAQGIAALAYGAGVEPCRVIVGPGNRWVTAAKQIVSRDVRIDMLAGPSELLIVADKNASPALIAADLLAQAEHDPDAVPMLVSLDERLIPEVNLELRRQLETLTTAKTAALALNNGFAVLAATREQAVELCEKVAPEHLELMVEDSAWYAGRLSSFGALFVGAASAEVLGDYGAGPNHVLPTGGSTRLRGGLSVFDFLRVSTALEIRDQSAASILFREAAELARIEGLEAHARAAEARLRTSV